eukprot:TRINITY_DN5390_c0_g1_i2.p1 TRINITY_DN5390_c0_g1~~TRINITY_DN5390_c0_g1_i2.p1  ORF type:complete len:751 (-),score=296.69 TRINITY_DN5390_c0_g1_i2:68-2320(-)
MSERLGNSILGGMISRLNPFSSSQISPASLSPSIDPNHKDADGEKSPGTDISVQNEAKEAKEDQIQDAEKQQRTLSLHSQNESEAKEGEKGGIESIELNSLHSSLDTSAEKHSNPPILIVPPTQTVENNQNQASLSSSIVDWMINKPVSTISSFNSYLPSPPNSLVNLGSSLYSSLPFTGSSPSEVRKNEDQLRGEGTRSRSASIENLLSLNRIGKLFTKDNNVEEKELLPPIRYKEFQEKLRNTKEGMELMSLLQGFLDAFSSNCGEISEIEQGKRIHLFLENLLQREEYYSFFQSLGIESEKRGIDWREHAAECLEQFLMLKLHKLTFAQSDETLEKDAWLHNRIESLQFLTAQHLDIPEKFLSENLWMEAREELLGINGFKSPRDKLNCILGSCKSIFKGLGSMMAADEQKEKKDIIATADDFLPIFIYVILRSNPPNLQSNIQFISTFRHPSRMMAESGYYFVSFLTAVTFIETMDASLLSIDVNDFESSLKKGSANYSEEDLVMGLVEEEGEETKESPKDSTENKKKFSLSRSESFTRRRLGSDGFGGLSQSIDFSLLSPTVGSSVNDWVWVTKRGNSYPLQDQKFIEHLSGDENPHGAAISEQLIDVVNNQAVTESILNNPLIKEEIKEEINEHSDVINSPLQQPEEETDVNNQDSTKGSEKDPSVEEAEDNNNMDDLYNQILDIQDHLDSQDELVDEVRSIPNEEEEKEKRLNQFLEMEAEQLSQDDIKLLLQTFKQIYQKKD